MEFIRSIRPINLVIIIITQLLCYYLIINPYFEAPNVEFSLVKDHLLFFLIATTLLLCASGYLINDIFDYQSDLINKKEKKLSPNSSWHLYFLLVIAGFILSIYTAYKYGNLNLSLIYPIALAGLFLYSSNLKKKGLVGNILVAVYSAGVIGIIWFAESRAISSMDPDSQNHIEHLLLGLTCFSFIASLMRELIKDMEDFKGDQAANYNTLPIKKGMTKSKYIVLFVGLIFSSSLILWGLKEYQSNRIESIFWIGLLLLLVSFSVFQVINGDYKKASNMIKFVMLLGIIYFIRISFIG